MYIAGFLVPNPIPHTQYRRFSKNTDYTGLNVLEASSEKQVFSEVALGSSNISRAICKKKVNTTTVFCYLLSVGQSTTSD